MGPPVVLCTCLADEIFGYFIILGEVLSHPHHPTSGSFSVYCIQHDLSCQFLTGGVRLVWLLFSGLATIDHERMAGGQLIVKRVYASLSALSFSHSFPVTQQVQADGEQHGQGEAVYEGQSAGNRAVAGACQASSRTAGTTRTHDYTPPYLYCVSSYSACVDNCRIHQVRQVEVRLFCDLRRCMAIH